MVKLYQNGILFLAHFEHLSKWNVHIKKHVQNGGHFSNEPMMHLITHNSEKPVHTCNNRVGHRAKLVQAKQEIPRWTGGRRCGRQWCPSGLDETNLSLVCKYKSRLAFVCMFLCLSQCASVYIVECTNVIAFTLTFNHGCSFTFMQIDLQMRTLEAIKTNKRPSLCKCYDKSLLA